MWVFDHFEKSTFKLETLLLGQYLQKEKESADINLKAINMLQRTGLKLTFQRCCLDSMV